VSAAAGDDSKPLLVAIAVLGEKVYSRYLDLIFAAEDAAYSAAVAAYRSNLITEPAAVELVERSNSGEVVQVDGADKHKVLHTLATQCAALQRAQQHWQDAQQHGEARVMQQVVAAVLSQQQYRAASEPEVQDALRGSVRVLTLYPRRMWHQHARALSLNETQGGYDRLQLFLQDLVSAVQQRQAEQQELLQLQQAVSATAAVFRAAPELYNMAVSARAEGAAGGDAEVLVQLLQALQPGWAPGIQQVEAALAPGGRCEQQITQLLMQLLLPRVEQCTHHPAAANILLAVAPQLDQELLRGRGLNDLVRKVPAVTAAVSNPTRIRALSAELRALLIYGATRPCAQVSACFEMSHAGSMPATACWHSEMCTVVCGSARIGMCSVCIQPVLQHR
jgi:hypothetical protein